MIRRMLMEINSLAPRGMPFDYFFNLFIFNGSVFFPTAVFSRFKRRKSKRSDLLSRIMVKGSYRNENAKYFYIKHRTSFLSIDLIWKHFFFCWIFHLQNYHANEKKGLLEGNVVFRWQILIPYYLDQKTELWFICKSLLVKHVQRRLSKRII